MCLDLGPCYKCPGGQKLLQTPPPQPTSLSHCGFGTQSPRIFFYICNAFWTSDIHVCTTVLELHSYSHKLWNNLLGKLFCSFVSMVRLVEPDFSIPRSLQTSMQTRYCDELVIYWLSLLFRLVSEYFILCGSTDSAPFYVPTPYVYTGVSDWT